jgi:peptidoglycan LD-endopeptidase LytH
MMGCLGVRGLDMAKYVAALAFIVVLATVFVDGIRRVADRWPSPSEASPTPWDERAVGAGGADATATRTPPGSGAAGTEGSAARTALAPAVAELRARQLTLPVSAARAEELVSTFEQPRGDRPHQALDIMAPRGTPVLAVEDGRIAKLFWSNAGGHTIYHFDPSERYAYYYAHLDKYAEGLEDGQSIRRGQVLGYVGSTGNARPDAPHLHFAIFVLTPEKQWWKGAAIDPYPVLRWAIAG